MGEKEGKKKDGAGAKGGGKDKKETAGGGGDGVITAVLKVDMHCQGCAKKVKRSVKGFEGVETVAADSDNNKLTVVGKVDPWKLRERVEIKTHKKVVLVSPTDLPRKQEEKKEEKKEEKPKEPLPPPVSVAFKMRLHCQGCIQRIRRSVYKVAGVEDVTIDPTKDLVTVKGTMDVKKMMPYLADKFKRTIELVPGKKDDGGNKKNKENKETEKKEEKKDKEKYKASAEKEKGGGNGGEKKKEGGNGGEKKKEGGGGDEKKKEEDGGKKEGTGGGEKKKEDGGGKKEDNHSGDGAAKVEVNKMDYYGGGGAAAPSAGYEVPYGYGNGYSHSYSYGYGYTHPVGAHDQYFSDENPNACSVM